MLRVSCFLCSVEQMLRHVFCRSDFSTFKTIMEDKTSFTAAVNLYPPLLLSTNERRTIELCGESARYPKSTSVTFLPARALRRCLVSVSEAEAGDNSVFLCNVCVLPAGSLWGA